MDGQSDPKVDGSSGGGMTIGGVTGAALGALGGWFFELHPPASRQCLLQSRRPQSGAMQD